MISLLRPGRGPNPLSLLATLLVVGGVFTLLRNRVPPPLPEEEWCDRSIDPLCAAVEDVEFDGPLRMQRTGSFGAPSGTVIAASEACLNAGYLCADLEREDRIRVRRWRGHEGTIVVHVPPPDFESAGDARRLQSAAAAGLRAWDKKPFPILVDLRGSREAHFAVRWSRSLGGSQIGVATTRWSQGEGLEVVYLQLATRSPHGGRVIDAQQIRLTAAHEMGHALGLPHSDSRRDVMYPTNTSISVSAQDYRTMEALYALEDGSEIVR